MLGGKFPSYHLGARFTVLTATNQSLLYLMVVPTDWGTRWTKRQSFSHCSFSWWSSEWTLTMELTPS